MKSGGTGFYETNARVASGVVGALHFYAEDFEPELPSKLKDGDGDQWAGEDEDARAKADNEEDNDEEDGDKKDPGARLVQQSQAYQRPKKKPLAERIAEKEAQEKKEKEEKKAKQAKQKDIKEMTVEEKQVEKERLRKVQEQETLSLAKGLFAENSTDSNKLLDQMAPITEDEFEKFGDALKSKVQFFEDSQLYPAFVVQLINDLSLTLGLEEVKKLGISVNSLYHEKERQRKETEKKKKKKSKVSIKVDRADDPEAFGDASGGGNYYDDDDFI
ncbi:hypothetical protein ACOMHN_016717 [Nucella lapillus]